MAAMNKPLHVLHISATKSWGGGENHLINLCHELRDDPGVKNIILCPEGSILHKRLQKMDVPYATAPLAYKIDLRYFLKIGRLCRRNNIDLIHIHDTTALSLTVMGDKFYNLPPFIFSKKTSFPIKDRPQTRFKYNYSKIRSILCVSEKTREVTSRSIDDQNKLKVIYHGTRFGKNKENNPLDLRKQFQLEPEVNIIGNIANHTRIKNVECFLEVADILVNQKMKKDFFFVQAGGFSKRTPALKAFVKERNLEKHVAFLDFVPDASGLLPQLDISVLTSENEGIAQFLYESFYNEIPVISTNVGGIPEIIENGHNGFLTERNDSSGIAEHVISLSEDSGLRDKFVSRSKKLLLEKFSTRRMAEQTLAEYKKVTNGKY